MFETYEGVFGRSAVPDQAAQGNDGSSRINPENFGGVEPVRNKRE